MARLAKKRPVAVQGSWLPLSLEFLRSKVCAELSPLALKLLVDALALLGPNAIRNGDLSLTPKALAIRGWSSRASLLCALRELQDAGLIVVSRQGSRMDCSLFAIALYPLDCDLTKLDIAPGSFKQRDLDTTPPHPSSPARWNRARKLKTVAPPRNNTPANCSATERKQDRNS